MVINIDKLKSHAYNLSDLLETMERELGTYPNHTLYLKMGKYGLYVEWGENKKSMNVLQKSIEYITLQYIIIYSV